MKILIRSLMGLVVFVTMTVNVFADEAGEENDALRVIIRSYEGETIMAPDGCPIYSATPVTFIPQDTDGGCQYCIRMEKDEDFGAYMEMESGEITLYPDDENNPCGTWGIKFKSVPEGRGSGSYTLVFDETAPFIEAEDPDAVTGYYGAEDSIGFDISDDKSGVSRVIMKCNDTVVDEIHPGEKAILNGPGEKVKVSFPVADTGEEANKGEIECYDLAGNHSTVSFEYRLDKSIPKVSLEGIEDGSYNTAGQSLVIRASDSDTDAVVCYVIERKYGDEILVNEVFDVLEEDEVSFENDGEYNVRAWAKDSAGNESEEEEVSFVIDTSPPEIAVDGVVDGLDIRSAAGLSIEIGDNIYKGSMVDITLNRTAQGKTETIRSDKYEMESGHETRMVNISSDGEYELNVGVTDGAGNRTDVTKNFRIDKTAPNIAISGIDEGEVTSQKPLLRFDAGEMFYDSTVLSAILEKREKGGYVNIDSRDRVMTAQKDHIDVEVPGEGQYRLTCIAADRSGNTSSSTVDFSVDHTPPVIADLSEVDNKFFKAFSLPWKVSALATDNTKVSVDAYVDDNRIDDEDTITEEGKYVLNILAEDEAGNAADDSATFIVDHTAPQIVLTGCDSEGNVKKGSTVSVSLLDEDDTLKSVKFNGRSIVIGADNTADMVIDDYGEYTIAVVAGDEAGNVTDTEIHTNCYMIGKTVHDYLKGGKTIMMPAPEQDEDDVDIAGLIAGLASVVGGTLGLSYRAVFRQ